MKPLTRAVEVINTVGFALITGAVIYFIIGSVAGLVHGDMLDWTFCGSAHYLVGADWCDVNPGGALGRFVHRLLNVTLPWFLIFWGFALVGLSSLLLKLLGYQYTPPGSEPAKSSDPLPPMPDN